MKKLGKLSINPEKVMSDEELVNLKGGYGYGAICCTASGGANGGTYCSDYYDLLAQWVSIWRDFGYTVECDYPIWA